jgi:hypothetical protein
MPRQPRLALCTTIYPGAERFLSDWYQSVRGQTDQDFVLWVGLDALGVDIVKEAMDADPEATWVLADAGATPAEVRQRTLALAIAECDEIVLVDCDDVLHPTRVASARAALQTHDLVGCALRVVDEQRRQLEIVFGLPEGADPNLVFPRHNVYGLSNSAMRSDVLRKCLPIPASCVLVDWFLATRAWLLGARLDFRPEIEMDYRQYDANLAKVVPPFDPPQVLRDTMRVREHFRILRAAPLYGSTPDRWARVPQVAADIEAFYESVALQPETLEGYVQALNTVPAVPVWWWCVANPALRHMWAQGGMAS